MEDQKQQEATVGAGAKEAVTVDSTQKTGSVGGPSTGSGAISEGGSSILRPAQDSGPKRKRWTRTHTVVLVVAMVLVWFVGVQIMAAGRSPAVVNVVEGVDKVGVNPVARLDFGDLSRDTGANRYVTLKNTGKMNKQIWVVKTGSISEMMKVDRPGSFTLKPGEEVKLEFNVQVPVSAPIQKYAGTVYIFKWPKLF